MYECRAVGGDVQPVSVQHFYKSCTFCRMTGIHTISCIFFTYVNSCGMSHCEFVNKTSHEFTLGRKIYDRCASRTENHDEGMIES